MSKIQKQIRELEQRYIELSRDKFYIFVKKLWNIFEPSPFIDSWHIGCICEHLEAQAKGEESLRKISINIPPRHCLEENTNIIIRDGIKPIKDLQIGDEVLSSNNHTITYDVVVDKVFSGNQPVYEINLKNGFKVTATRDHRFKTEERYLEVKYLRPGDKLKTIGWLYCEESTIESIEFIGVKPTYDIETKNYHCFFANKILSHNSKSRIASILYPSWLWVLDPKEQIIIASNSLSLATEFNLFSRDCIRSDFYKKLINNKWELREDINAKTKFYNTDGGQRNISSVTSAILGMNATTLIMDDLNSIDNGTSSKELDKVINYYKTGLRTRQNNPRTTKWVNIQQRLAEGDITDFLNTEEGDWFNLVLPAEYDPKLTFISPININDRRKPKEILCPERFDLKYFNSLKRDVFKWNALYQQNPLLDSGNIIKREWFTYFNSFPEKYLYDKIIYSIDTAEKDAEANDYTAIIKLGKIGDLIYVLDIIREKLLFPDLLNLMRQLEREVNTIVIEGKSSGTPLFQMLDKEFPGKIELVKYVIGNKIERVYYGLPSFVKKSILFPTEKLVSNVSLLEQDLLGFPKRKHKDLVDSLFQGIYFLNQKSGRIELNIYQQKKEEYFDIPLNPNRLFM